MTKRCLLFCLTVLLSGCTYRTFDVRRPLVIENVPVTDEQLASVQHQFPNVLAKNLRQSFQLSRDARNMFGFHKHNDWSSFVPVSKLVKAIDLVPKNPYAWVQLGAYLALDHQSQAAIMATERGLEVLDGQCVHICSPEWQQLRTTARLNLAAYRLEAERPLGALLALQQITRPADRALERLIYFWTSADVKSALGDVAGAREDLRHAAAVPEAELMRDELAKEAYPHYFGDSRLALHAYLEAVVEIEAANDDAAEAKLREAIAKNDSAWDAYLLLSDVQYRRKDYNAAIATLLKLKGAAPQNDLFHPERLCYNLGNAYLARYQLSGNKHDLEAARENFEQAIEFVSKRFASEQRQVRRAGAFRNLEHPETARFFLDALGTTSPFYADAYNNLGTVFLAIADCSKGEVTWGNWAADAEMRWRSALRDQYWPRRQLAYANLARLYAREQRLSAAAEAAESAMDLDPFNVVPLKALLAVAESESDLSVAAKAAHAAARLVFDRRWRYPPGIFDDLFAQAAARFKAIREGRRDSPVRRAARMIELALAGDDQVRDVLLGAQRESPEWLWPEMVLAREVVAQGGTATEDVQLFANQLESEVTEQDWIVRHERGDAFVLRAELRAQSKDWRGSRRDIERSLAYGVSPRSIELLRLQVEKALQWEKAPPVSSLAVTPFDTIYSDEPGAWGHSLSWSMTAILRGARGPMVRSLDREALEDADWNAISADEIGRRSGIGAVLTGRYAKARRLVIIDVRVVDSVTGTTLFSHRYETSPKQLRETQIAIAEDALNALKLPPNRPVREVVASQLTSNAKAYANYLAGMDILLSGAQTKPQFMQAETLFAEAVDQDKRFGLAYAGLAWARYGLANLHVRPAEIMPATVDAAERAAKLAPNASEAQLALALVRTWFDWDFVEGSRAFKAAIESDWANSLTHRLYGDFLAARGELPAALREKSLAVEYAPFSAQAVVDVGFIHFYLKDYQKALGFAEEALALQPKLAKAYMLKAWVYTSVGRWREAINAIDLAAFHSYRSKETPLLIAHRGVTYAMQKDFVRAKQALDELEARRANSDGYVLPLLDARVLAALDRPIEAREKLCQAWTDRSESMVWLPVDPWFDSLRSDSGFVRIMEEVGSQHRQQPSVIAPECLVRCPDSLCGKDPSRRHRRQ